MSKVLFRKPTPAESRELLEIYLKLTEHLVRDCGLSLSFLSDAAGFADAKRRPNTPQRTISSDSLLAPPEAAIVLGLAEKTLANYRTSGAGPTFVKTGSRIRYRYSDLTSFIDQGRRKSTSQVAGDEVRA
jgi:hypothetical protein